MPHETAKRPHAHARQSLATGQAKLQPQDIQPSTLSLDERDAYFNSLRSLVAPHVESFNFTVGLGLQHICEDLEPVFTRSTPNSSGESTYISIRFNELSIQKPRYNATTASGSAGVFRNLLPMQCRITGTNYVGDLYGSFTVSFDGVEAFTTDVQRIARIPVMVGSSACHLHSLSRDELLSVGEEEYEFGGIFIMNGGERVIRNTLIPRPNHAISARRDRYTTRGPLFTDLVVSFRSMRRDMSMSTNHFHFLKSGAVRIRFTIRMREYFIPVGVLLRALLPAGTTDREIFDLIVGGQTDDMDIRNSAIAILQELHERYPYMKKADAEIGIKPSLSPLAALSYLGRNFRTVIGRDDESVSDLEAGMSLLRRFILVHLSVGPHENDDDSLDRSKAELIIYLIRKLVATAAGTVEVDDADALSHQGVMTSGHLYSLVLKEQLGAMLGLIGLYITQEGSKDSTVDTSSGNNLITLVKNCITKGLKSDSVSKGLCYLISTGNIDMRAVIDLPQKAGYSVLAERINFFRYLSHFRAVHRGAFYAGMRSTKVRKLLPEAWGFICPVHTPDGDPCGILNHLAADAIITHGNATQSDNVIYFLSDMNILPSPCISFTLSRSLKGTIPILVDGRVVGYVHRDNAKGLVDQLRYSKIRDKVTDLLYTNEIALIMPVTENAGFMPGIYIHTCGARLMRPVRWLKERKSGSKGKENKQSGMNEYIGTLEQVFMRIRPAVADNASALSAVDLKYPTHEEISNVNFLSVLAQLSPFPDMNQGPRNMFQCQMAKQTMGTPCHAVWNRMDSKTYQHCTPQVPITRNFCMQNPIGADLFPNGVNAIVAVISYTGNDMEDALIINKASIERGFARGSVYTNTRVNLDENRSGRESMFFPASESIPEGAVDRDGLPKVGARVQYGTKLYGKGPKHARTGTKVDWVSHKSVESGIVDNVTVFDSDVYAGVKTTRGEGIRQANVRVRIPRLPTVGDKFASRAGQKGTMSAAWPSQDMPFSESGITPDILFNPNGFPSRMTIGMMVEIMSGKSGALHGMFNDSTPFQFDEEVRAVDFFADQLVKAGYQHSGNETLYSGYTGEPLQVEIFTGIVHYQRLRHMVSDKFQVRSTGTVNPLYRQPIKGRKRGGAIRFGEMERDGLLAHGASFLLRDRLALASDLHVLHVCESCGSLLSPIKKKTDYKEVICMVCEADERKGCVRKVALPYSFKYLVNEFAAMNIRTVLKLKEVV